MGRVGPLVRPLPHFALLSVPTGVVSPRLWSAVPPHLRQISQERALKLAPNVGGGRKNRFQGRTIFDGTLKPAVVPEACGPPPCHPQGGRCPPPWELGEMLSPSLSSHHRLLSSNQRFFRLGSPPWTCS